MLARRDDDEAPADCRVITGLEELLDEFGVAGFASLARAHAS